MVTTETRRRIVAAGLLLLPMFLVKATGMFLSPSQATAASASAVPGAEGRGSPLAPSAREANLAATHVADLSTKRFGPTPFYYRPREPEETVVEEGPQFSVQAVVAAPAGNSALIDGKLYRAGDRLGRTPWRVVRIDGNSRSVLIEDERNQKRMTLAVRLPK